MEADIPGSRESHNTYFESDLVLPVDMLAKLVAAADILTSEGIGQFYLAETDLNDPDGVRIHYRGKLHFTQFAYLAGQIFAKPDLDIP